MSAYNASNVQNHPAKSVEELKSSIEQQRQGRESVSNLPGARGGFTVIKHLLYAILWRHF